MCKNSVRSGIVRNEKEYVAPTGLDLSQGLRFYKDVAPTALVPGYFPLSLPGLRLLQF